MSELEQMQSEAEVEVAKYIAPSAHGFSTSLVVGEKRVRVKFEEGRYTTEDPEIIAAFDKELAKPESAVARYVRKLDKEAAESLVRKRIAGAAKGGQTSLTNAQTAEAMFATNKVIEQMQHEAQHGTPDGLQLTTDDKHELPPATEKVVQVPVKTAAERLQEAQETDGGEAIVPRLKLG